MLQKAKTKWQSPTNTDGRKISPFSSKKKLIINLKDNPNQIPTSPKHTAKNSPKSNDKTSSPSKSPPKSPKNSDKNRRSIIHTQRFDRSRTLKVVFRRPSEIINPHNIQNIENEQKTTMQRNFSIDIDFADEKNPLKMIPKSLILYEEAKKLLKKVRIKLFFSY